MIRRLVPLLLLACSACGRSDPAALQPVEGQVFFENRPAQHALVVFHPLSGGNAPRPHGKVDGDGSFTLTTNDTGDGAPAGEYAVTVEWWLSSGSKANPAGYDAPAVNRLPQRYGKVETSGLRVRVGEGSNRLTAFRLSR